jgi:hypothetical protein
MGMPRGLDGGRRVRPCPGRAGAERRGNAAWVCAAAPQRRSAADRRPPNDSTRREPLRDDLTPGRDLY